MPLHNLCSNTLSSFIFVQRCSYGSRLLVWLCVYFSKCYFIQQSFLLNGVQSEGERLEIGSFKCHPHLICSGFHFCVQVTCRGSIDFCVEIVGADSRGDGDNRLCFVRVAYPTAQCGAASSCPVVSSLPLLLSVKEPGAVGRHSAALPISFLSGCF